MRRHFVVGALVFPWWSVALLGVGGLSYCDKPQPPVPPPITTTTTLPLHTPDPCVVPVDDEAHWRFLGTEMEAPSQMRAIVLGAKPKIPTPDLPDRLLDALVLSLRAHGVCAGVPAAIDGKRADAVFVQRPDGLWEQFHAVSYQTNSWRTFDWYEGVWRYTP
jgi:hypothetical protein